MNFQDPANDCLEIVAFTNVDVTSPAGGPNSPYRQARKIRVITGSGTIVLKVGSGATRTLTMVAGEEEIIAFTEVVSASGITRARISW